VQHFLYTPNEGSHWYVKIGCYRHVLGDKNNFLTWKPVVKGNVTLRNNTPGKIIRVTSV